ncbi:MAG: amino acid permease-associated region, partial [Marmoricola sp.]|nr:amino acid permease-associated region [Marmoricola sp.]
CIAMLYLAYLGVTVPLLVRRLRHPRGLEGGVDEDGQPLFSLGRWGVAVNAAAIAYQVVMVVNLAWPRAAIYDLTSGTWWLRWSALLFIGLTLVVGAVIHWRTRVRHGGPIRLPVLKTSHEPTGAAS